ncbi:MAG: CTP synthase [Candidatus Gracilibacteria bacterium]|nr:CTP synthase [Candidatus Gracilibacteria bacterium]
MKLIFVTGGAISGLGKGVTSSSIGRLIKSAGKSVGMIKMDPYLQIDAGTMSPYEHGEVFVTQDGGECDLDIGNYERFTDENLAKENNITTGKVYQAVINRERVGGYLGKTVQIVPHITNEIKEQILETAKNYDFTIIEVGGTVGDIESAPFLEAIRQMKKDLGKSNVFYMIVAPLLHLSYSGEVKTKLIQSSVVELRKCGIIPDAIIYRTEVELEEEIKDKLSRTCDICTDAIIEAKNVSTIYKVPEYFNSQNLLKLIGNKLEVSDFKANLNNWNKLVNKITNPKKEVNIGVVGKYTQFQDTYKSISESFIHAGVENNCKVNLVWIDAEKIEKENNVGNENKVGNENFHSLQNILKNISGVLIPGGFGNRGVEGKILTVQYLRENNIPFLGICLGLQVAVIEYARNKCGLLDANSLEFNEKANNLVIDLMEEQKLITEKGGTMRLGSYEAKLKKGSLAEKLYKENNHNSPLAPLFTIEGDNLIITERHRHRYEVNSKYHKILEEKGLVISGKSPNRDLAEFIEIKDHKFFIATQSHPEFKSRLEKPHPLFVGLVKASLDK